MPDESRYCNACGADQAPGGVYKVAEIAGALGRGAKRAVWGAGCGAFAIAATGFVLFLLPFTVFTAPSAFWTYITVLLILAAMCAVGSAASPKFMFLISTWAVYAIPGWIATTLCLGTSAILAVKIIYVIMLLTLLPLTWIWYIVRAGLVAPPKQRKQGIIDATKSELIDTFKEVKRFGRR